MVLALIATLISFVATVAAIWVALARVGSRKRVMVDPALLEALRADSAEPRAALNVEQLRRMSTTELIREIMLLRIDLSDAKRDVVEARHEAAEALRVAGQRPSARSRVLLERQWRARRELPDEATQSELPVVA